jgi:pimeloyl-ACP methyl ester carboxylesterase
VDHVELDVDCLRLACLVEGPASGPLVVCAHGFPDSPSTWRHLMADLARAGCRVVAPAMRGYAPSGLGEGVAPEAARLGLDLLGVGEALSPSAPFVLVGHDWGAIAAYAAAQIAPGRLAALVAMAVPPMPAVLHAMADPAQRERSWYIRAFQEPGYEDQVRAQDFALIRRLWADWSPGLDAPDDVERAIEAIRDPARTTAALDYYRALLDPARHDPALAEVAERLGDALDVPTLYLHGRRDGCMGLDSIGEVAPHLPEGSVVEVFAEAGHFLHLEDPERTSQLVLDFLLSLGVLSRG